MASRSHAFRAALAACSLVLCLCTGCGGNDSSAPSETTGAENSVGITSDEGIYASLGETEEGWSLENSEYLEEYVKEGGTIAYVTGQSHLDDGGFNEAIFSGVQQYAFSAGESYSYYMAEGSLDEDYLAAIGRALSYDSSRLIVAAGSGFAEAVGKYQDEYPDIAFLLVDGVPEDEDGNEIAPASNVHCIRFSEQESGYLAGYMAVLDGFRDLGFIGGQSVDAVIRYGSGYLQGIDDAADALGVSADINVRYWYAETFLPADYIYDMACDWYDAGTEVIFSCGGSLYESVLAAANEKDGMLIGVDINQNDISERFLTSAVKGIDRAVIISLDDYFGSGDCWSGETAGIATSYGAKEYCASLPLEPWRFRTATQKDYENLVNELTTGAISISDDTEHFPDLAINVEVTRQTGDTYTSDTPVWSHQAQVTEGQKTEESATEDTDSEEFEPAEESGDWLAAYEKETEDADILALDLYDIPSEHLNTKKRTQGEISFDADDALNYADDVHCLFDIPSQQLIFQCRFDSIPSSDDSKVYLFRFNTWENSEDLTDQHPVAETEKGHAVQMSLDYDRTELFSCFVPALKVNGSYVAVSPAKYVTDPEVLAPNQNDYPAVTSKKGLLLDPQCLGTEKLTDLNVGRGVYNIPLSMILGESSDPEKPTTEFEFGGKTYLFNTAELEAFDNIFTYLTNAGIQATAIVLNDWNEAYPEIIHPLSRNRTSSSLYYAFNTEEEDGAKLVQAVALFLAERYTSGEYGYVYDWVIANEINQETVWNYMDTTDVEYYVSTFEKSFRIFYNAIRSRCANARVSFSLDHDWNSNGGYNSKWFNGREILYTFNQMALRGGNYNWHAAIHPYPSPLTRVNYWDKNYDQTEEAEYLTIMNLSSLTSILDKESFRCTDGSIRDSAVTELGFSSYSGEKLQAAAFAYCYYIIDSNPYFESFLMNRQTDSVEEIKSGLALGIYNTDLSPKYIKDIYSNIDQVDPEDDLYLDFTLNMLNASSLEEALSWANP